MRVFSAKEEKVIYHFFLFRSRVFSKNLLNRHLFVCISIPENSRAGSNCRAGNNQNSGLVRVICTYCAPVQKCLYYEKLE